MVEETTRALSAPELTAEAADITDVDGTGPGGPPEAAGPGPPQVRAELTGTGGVAG